MLTFRNMPIRQKLMVIIMVITGAALLLSAVGILGSDSILFRGYLERDISGLARIIADNSTAALAFEDSQSAAETLAALRARSHIIDACIYRPNGSILARYTRAGATAPCPAPRAGDSLEFSRTDLSASHPIVLNNKQIGTLIIAYDLGEIGERRQLYGGTVLGVLLASSLIAFLLSSKLRDTIAAPILHLADTTAAVSKTKDYSVRAQKLSSDELGVLVDALNEMLAGIQSRDTELGNALLSREDALFQAHTAHDSLETTLASIGDAVVSTDLEGRVFFANRVALGLLGWSEDEIKGKPLDDVFTIVNEFTHARLANPVAKVLREGEIVAVSDHAILLSRDGAEIPVDTSAAPIRRENGPVQGAVLVFRDVSSRRRADETSRLLASIVESSADAIFATSLDGIVASWNSGAERIFGYTANEIVGRSISTIATPEHQEERPLILQRIATGERVANFETVQRTKDGRLIHVALTISPLRDALGRVIGASTVARDITGRVQNARRLAELNASLQRTNENLARSNEDLERFAFVASHDLQEPLRMITVYSQLLVKMYSQGVDEKATAFVGNIVGGTQRMRELLADLLAYTEVGAELEDAIQPVDLNETLEKVKQNLNMAIGASGAEIVADPMPALRVHEAHLIPLFQNLIGNAIKYRGTAAPRIRISVETLNKELRFAVADNGMGIEPEYHDKIFVPFKRLHGKAIPGTGIGLSICQRVVERYGGRIWVESEPGAGATFIFLLPLSAAAEELLAKEKEA